MVPNREYPTMLFHSVRTPGPVRSLHPAKTLHHIFTPVKQCILSNAPALGALEFIFRMKREVPVVSTGNGGLCSLFGCRYFGYFCASVSELAKGVGLKIRSRRSPQVRILPLAFLFIEYRYLVIQSIHCSHVRQIRLFSRLQSDHSRWFGHLNPVHLAGSASRMVLSA